MRPIPRREFLRGAAAIAAGVGLSSCTGVFSPVRPRFGMGPGDVDTRWPIKRVVYLMLENRSFDNLFSGFPGAKSATVGVDMGRERPLIRCPDWLPGDLPHDRFSAELMLRGGEMDGFAMGEFGDPWAYSRLLRRDIPAYWEWAREYVLCDNFFASMLGPSYPNHLFFVAGSGGGAIDNPENTGVRRVEIAGKQHEIKSWGCDAHGDDMYVLVMDEQGNVTKHGTCFDLETVGEQLSRRNIDWAYYSPEPHQPGYIWNAYSAVRSVFHEDELWQEHISPVDDLMMDIEAGALPPVTWIVPRWQLSDHPPASTRHAHNWVVDIVNRIMRGPMWEETAIFITWDEWGGFYDHVEPPKLGEHHLGFRVPMLVISPYARRGYIDDGLAEFTAPLRFIADNWGLPYLTPRYEQVHNFEHVFDFDRGPRPPVPGRKAETYGNPFDFPDTYPAWPEGTEPKQPNFAM